MFIRGTLVRVSKVNRFKQSPHERIQQLRICLAVHSYIYYELCDNLVSDARWQAWAQELIEMHIKHPEYTDDYDKYFDDWDGTTGFHLCKIPGLYSSAMKIMRKGYEQSK